ncbi:hypothetical protein ACFR9U_04575 [Halorientalis brevis]|uniref:Uncharacterized protein n=1 Tax=Halorientalis brevis TaxID=1126241 RepID=A0ABD6C7S6_9EURY|nr:hypothetical protein [Halorientalis brevis]
MKSGVIGIIDGDFSSLESEQYSTTHDEQELKRCIDVENSIDLSDGTRAISGRAAIEKVINKESGLIQGGKIGTTKEKEIIVEQTEFLAFPPHVVLIKSGSGSFTFDLIGRQTGTLIDRGNLNLRSFYEDHKDANVWQAGFYGTDNKASNGVVYGEGVMGDSEFERVLEVSDLNQLGVEYPYEDEHVAKIALTESGYLNLHQPSDFEVEDFAEFFREEVLNYVTKSSD